MSMKYYEEQQEKAAQLATKTQPVNDPADKTGKTEDI